MHPIIEDLQWRYATKKFDPLKKVSDDDLAIIKKSLQLTPSSYGLQPLKFLIIENPKVREELVAASYNQKQVADASHLFILCAYNNLTEAHVKSYMELIAKTREIEEEKLVGFSEMIKNTSLKLEKEKLEDWMRKQAYIVLGQLLHTCASLRIDSVPMEGFNPDEYDRILGLQAKNLHATLVCPIGYRSVEDNNQHLKKVRKNPSDLFETI